LWVSHRVEVVGDTEVSKELAGTFCRSDNEGFLFLVICTSWTQCDTQKISQ